MLGILNHSQTLWKIPLLHLSQTLTLRSQCLTSTLLSDEPKLAVLQITSLWKHYDSFHTPPRNTSSLTTTTVSCWAPPLTTGNSAKSSWFIKAIKRTADLCPVIAPFLWQFLFSKFMPVWSNNASPIPLIFFSTLTSMDSEPNARTPLHVLIYIFFGLVTILRFHWPPASCCSPPQIWYSLSTRPSNYGTLPECSFFSDTDPTGDSSSFLLSRGIRQASPQPLPLHHRSLGTHNRSPLLFPRNFLLYTLDFFIHTHLLTWNMLMTQFSLPVIMIPSADFYIFSNTWPHELNWSSPQWIQMSAPPSPCHSPSFPLSDCRCRFAMQLSLLCSLFLYYSGHFISWCSTHSTHRCEISRFLHHSYLIVHSRRQLSLFSSLLRLQDTRSILSTSSCFSETQAPGLHPNCPIHPSPRSESQIYSPAQITKINSFHYK